MQTKIWFFLFFLFVFKPYSPIRAGISHLDVKDGLSNNEVTSFYQDHKGFVWIGTYDGLNRYDGYKFTTFRHNLSNANSLVNNRVLSITQDQKQNLWIGTEGGVNRYDILNSKFHKISFKSKNNKLLYIQGKVNMVKAIMFNQMAIASETEGLLIFKEGSRLANSIPLQINNTLIYNYNATSITVDGAKKTWVFVNGVGLCWFDKKANYLQPHLADLKNGNFILADGFKNIWIGTDNGLYQFNIASNLLVKKSNFKVNHLCIDHSQKLWIASDGKGILILDLLTGTVRNYEPKTQNRFLENPVVYSIFEDRENRKWIGTLRSGIVRIDADKLLFQTYSHVLDRKTKLNADFILSIAKDSENNVWVGTDGDGIKKWDREMKSFVSFKNEPGNNSSLNSNNVTEIKSDKQHTIWITTWGGGVSKYNKASNNFKHYQLYNTKTKTYDHFGWRIYEDKKGHLWISTYNGGVYRYRASGDYFELMFPDLISVLSFSEDNTGNLWVGTRTSLVKVDQLHKKHISFFVGYAVRAIHEDKKGDLWLGTEGGGLLKFDDKSSSFKRLTDQNGLSNNSILNILEDDYNCLWMSTYSGISRFNIQTQKFINYTQSDGLQSNQFNYNAAISFGKNQFLFGGIQGFNSFDPLQVNVSNTSKNPFKISLEEVRVGNLDIRENKGYIANESADVLALIIPYNLGGLYLNFTKPEFSSPDKIKYAFYLKGLEKEWNYTENLQSANYGKLPIGSYTFYVKATDKNGNWLAPQYLLSIRILAPWYLTWWAYIIYTLIIVVILTLFSKYRAGKREAEFTIRQTIREKEQEKELSEKRLSFFTNVSHEFRTPLTLILNPLKEIITGKEKSENKQELDIAYRNAKRLMTLVDQLLLFRKIENEFEAPKLSAVNLQALCLEVYSYFMQEAKSKRITYNFIDTPNEINLEIDREKIEMAIFNILANALKFTPEGGEVMMIITQDKNVVSIEIRDDGIGIEEGVGDKLFENFYQVKSQDERKSKGFGIGLYLAKNIILQHHGDLTYESKLGKGTSFYITLPIYNRLVDMKSSDIAPNLDKLYEVNDGLVFKEKGAIANVSISKRKSLLIIDDNIDIRNYIKDIFIDKNVVYEAGDGISGLKMARDLLPDLIISDLIMPGISGTEICKEIKNDIHINHIPIILLTGNTTDEAKLEGIESGAVDYITKPFDKALLVAKVTSLLENRNRLQQFFLETITLQYTTAKVPLEYKSFLDKCIVIIENNVDNEDFSVQKLALEMGMSHSNLYKKVKTISGLTISGFIRSIRLRKAAVLMLKNNYNVNQAAFEVGISDVKYFRTHFFELFGLKPSDYIRKYRNNFNRDHTVIR